MPPGSWFLLCLNDKGVQIALKISSIVFVSHPTLLLLIGEGN